MSLRYPGVAPGVFRISSSELETYLRCGLRWQFDREDFAARIRRSTIPMAIGTACAAAARADNLAKIAAAAQPSLSDLTEIAVAEYEHELDTCDMPESGFEKADGKDSAASAALRYATDISPSVRDVVLAEEPIVALVDDGIELAGRPDWVTRDTVEDLKTGQPWSQERVDRSRQLTGYTLSFEARMRRAPQCVAIQSLRRAGKKGWSAQTIWSSRGEPQKEAFIGILRSARDAITAGVALPAPEGAWWCSAKWCPHAGRCPAFHGSTEQNE